MKAYFDISAVLEEFYKKAHMMNSESLTDAISTLGEFLQKYVDQNSRLFNRGVEVMHELYSIMSVKYPVEKNKKQKKE